MDEYDVVGVLAESRKARVVGSLLLAALLVVGVHAVYISIQAENEINQVKKRAQLSGDAEDMRQYLVQLRDNMEDWGYTDGYYNIIYRNPYSNAANDYKAVNRLIDRLEGVEQMEKDSVEYQTALEDIRGTLRELEFRPVKHFYMKRLGLA